MSLVSGPTMPGKRRRRAIDDVARVVDAERRLGNEGQLFRVRWCQRLDVLHLRDQMDLPLDTAHGSFDFRVAGMADQHDLEAFFAISLPFPMDLGHQRAGRIDHRQIPFLPRFLDGIRYPVGAENRGGAPWDFVDVADENGAFFSQPIDDVLIVHDFVAHIDGC